VGIRGLSMTINAKLAVRISLIAALLLLAIVAYNLTQPAMTVCGDLDPNYQPIIAFELARSVPDLHAIFGDAPSACRETLTARFAFINTADNYLFIPLYGIFLFFFFRGIRDRDEKLARLGAILVLAACIADYVENTCLFGIAANSDVHGTALSLLPWATGVKWLGLAVAGAAGGYILARAGGWRWLIALACFAGLAIVLAAIADPRNFGYLASNGVTISWVIFLIADAVFVFRRPAIQMN
jgi:hypothetical protein